MKKISSLFESDSTDKLAKANKENIKSLRQAKKEIRELFKSKKKLS